MVIVVKNNKEVVKLARMTDYIQVITLTPDRRGARKIADALIKRKLAGCVQIVGPVESAFVWKGKLRKAREWMCLIKTKKTKYHEIEAEIKKIHGYKVPEILAFPISEGSKEYLGWLESCMA
jgi:periplasmic divalent cation tolerance protein